MATASSFRQILGAPPSTATPSDSTLIIIDAQNEYAEGNLKVSDVGSSRTAIGSLLQKYRDGGGSIVHVVHATPAGAPVFTPGTKLAEEFEELKPRDGEKVVQKHHPGSFAGTDLQEHLEGLGPRESKIVLTGYMVSTAAGFGSVIEQLRVDLLAHLLDLLHRRLPVRREDLRRQLAPRAGRHLVVVGREHAELVQQVGRGRVGAAAAYFRYWKAMLPHEEPER